MDAKLLALVCALPASIAEVWAKPLTDAMTRWGIDTPARRAMFLAQCTHESDGFTAMSENLNYSAEGLAKTWPPRYSATGKKGGAPNELALRIARKPELIANYTYANRMGNGPPESGDGWEYRARGPIGITGADMYRRAGAALGIDLLSDPGKVEDPQIGAQVAAWVWYDKGCNVYADRGDIFGSSKAINGNPPIGVPQRTKLWQSAKRHLGVN
jgi:putative chitinase